MQGKHHKNHCHTKCVYEKEKQRVLRKLKLKILDNFRVEYLQNVIRIKIFTYVSGFVHQMWLHKKVDHLCIEHFHKLIWKLESGNIVKNDFSLSHSHIFTNLCQTCVCTEKQINCIHINLHDKKISITIVLIPFRQNHN